jgi:hypothetical protein
VSTALKRADPYVKLSTQAVDKSVDGLRVPDPSAGTADEFFILVSFSPPGK